MQSLPGTEAVVNAAAKDKNGIDMVARGLREGIRG
jgi:hypothetical protein